MKKILVLIALSTVVFPVFAQDSKFTIGVEAAGIRTYPWGDDVSDDINPLFSASPGINLDYSLNSKLSVKTSLIYERKGWTTEITNLDINSEPIGTQDHTARFDYLTIPVLLSYSTQGTVRFYVNGGTYFGFLLSNTITLGKFDDYPEQTNDVSEDTKDFDFGLSFGCGVFLPIGERYAFDFGLRDNLGMIDIFKPENDGKARFNTLGLVVSIKYRL